MMKTGSLFGIEGLALPGSRKKPCPWFSEELFDGMDEEKPLPCDLQLIAFCWAWWHRYEIILCSAKREVDAVQQTREWRDASEQAERWWKAYDKAEGRFVS